MEAIVHIAQLPPLTLSAATSSEARVLTLNPEDAPQITLSIGRHAPQADLSIWVEQGETRLLVALTIAPPNHADFRPITIDYLERPSAVGQIPGNFQRRELRQNDHEVRVSRLIDRALRPLFSADERREVHLVVQVFSVDPTLDLIGLAITSAGLAATCSVLPFNGPIIGSSLTVEEVKEEHRCLSCPAKSNFEWVMTAHPDGLVMIEGGTRESLTPARPLIEALKAHATSRSSIIEEITDFSEQYQAHKSPYVSPIEVMEHPAFDECIGALASALQEQDKRIREHKYQEILANLKIAVGADPSAVELTLWSLARAYLRSEALEGRRQDGRHIHEMRRFEVKMGVLPRAHGSALITRGSTQVLVSATQGSQGDAPTYETLFSQARPELFCHYNFPGYATHQARQGRGPNRREIGHGLLIQRALSPLYPVQRGKSVRLLADVLSSDGSSSMASVIGANIALAQAGHHLNQPIVGLSIGLVTDEDAQSGVLLVDITGDEDFYGDMDFKIVGAQDGICALQLDNKVGALPWSLIESAITAATEAHAVLLDELSEHLEAFGAPTPRFTGKVEVSPQLIGRVIGRQGETLKTTEKEFGVHITVDKTSAQVNVEGADQAQVDLAIERMRSLGTPLESGETFDAVVDGVKEFGVFVTFNHHSGLVHVSQLLEEGGQVSRHFKVGDSLKVMVLGSDQKGRLKLSHLATRD